MLQEVYEEEGLEWSFKDYPDNAARLELFEQKPTGIFALCDEAVKLPAPSDEKLAKSLYEKCKEKKSVIFIIRWIRVPFLFSSCVGVGRNDFMIDRTYFER